MNRYKHLLPLFLFSPDGVPTGSAAASTAAAATEEPATGNTDSDDTPDGEDAEPEAISQNATIQELRSDLQRANLRITELIGEKRKLKSQKNGLTVNSTELEGFRKLGTLADVTARLKAGDDAVKAQATATKKSNLAAAAAADGYDAEAVASLQGALENDYSTEGEDKDKKGFVTYKDESGKEQKKRVGDWLKEKYPLLADKLIADAKSSSSQQQRNVRSYGRSAPVGTGGNKQTLAERIREEEKTLNERGSTTVGGEKRATLAERMGKVRR